MRLTAGEKSWFRLLTICWIFTLLLSSGQVLAEEVEESVKHVIIVKNERGEPINNAVFEIQNDKNEVLETCVSDADGCAIIKNVNEGKYHLTQIKTLAGYELAKQRSIEIKIENPVTEEVVINQKEPSEPKSAAKIIDEETGPEINENNLSDVSLNEKSTETEITTGINVEKSENLTNLSSTPLIVNDIKVNIAQVTGSTTQFIISTVGYAGKTGIGKVCFPTWSERNGQDDLRWYEGTLDSKGEYSLTVDVKDHSFETGIYNIHTYIYGLKGEVIKTFTNTQSLETQKPAISLTEVTNNAYKVRLTGASNPQGVSRVSFPTWTQIDGQDDLRWEPGTYVGNDTWEATIHINDYKRSYDTFITHAYIMNKDGQLKYSGAIDQIVKNPFLEESLEIKIQPDNNPSKFSIVTQNCSGKTGAKSVAFAVWTKRNGQDELKWYEGALGPDGEFYGYVDIENHGFETGPFVVHAYLRGTAGETIAFANSEFTMPVVKPTIEYDNAVLNNVFKIRIKNVSNENGVASIVFPTWSRTNGQDDVRWEQAIYIGNNTWEATINLTNYNTIVDDFITHAYLVDKNGKTVFVKESVKRISQNTATIYGFFAYPLDKNYQPDSSDPTDWFGLRWGDIHEGIDIPADRYASCYSVANGVVEKAGYFMGYGRYIRIRTTDRYGESVSFFYGHLQEINVSVGQSVSMGQKIGSVGGSGYNAQGKYIDDAYGSHLHFGAIANADYACVDPEIWIDFHNPYRNAN
ncbi:MAG: GBS Bsp-like repeat-containing protein [Acetobacterium woodii]|nr:GBS Bsp-like repeat-containing protein [Acetobacterium woodii]